MGDSHADDRPVLNVLTSSLFVVRGSDGAETTRSLTSLIALLLTEDDPVAGYPGLTIEQRSHWHRFLVRCAARALRTMEVDIATATEMARRELSDRVEAALIDAAGDLSAWDLVPESPSVAGFLQTPVTGAETPDEAGYRRRAIAELTALIGSKEFERKSEAARYLDAHEVVYGLIEYQSGVIYGGRGNYPTALTPSNSGKGSGVPFMGIEFDDAGGRTFQWGVETLLADWSMIRDERGLQGTVWAVWTRAWDGKGSLPSTQLDPAFIPYARMVRICAPDALGRFDGFLFRSSNDAAITDHTDGAVFGDPFTALFPNPKHEDQWKVRGVMERGFGYSEVVELLGFGDRGQPSRSVERFYHEPDSAELPNVGVRFEGVAYEQGKTLGFHTRRIPLPVSSLGALTFSDPDPFREVHSGMLERIDEVKRILRAASRIVLHGEPRPHTGDDALVALSTNALDEWADRDGRYLDFLFRAAREQIAGSEAWIEEWAKELSAKGKAVFNRALPSLPAPGAQRLEREVSALSYVDRKLWTFRKTNTAVDDTEPVTTEATR